MAIKRVSIYDMDGTIVCSMHRYKTDSTGKIDLQFWRDNQHLAMSDKLLPLAEQYKKAAQDVDFYEKTALPQAKRLIDLADISRRNGEIGYAEWSIATMQSWGIEQAYLEAIRAYNRVVVEIQTLFDFKN